MRLNLQKKAARSIAWAVWMALATACNSYALGAGRIDGITTLISYGTQDGPRTIWEVKTESLERQPLWAPEDGPPPISITQACEVAATWLRAKYPEIKVFEARSVVLNSHSHRNGSRQGTWYYMIDYSPVIGGNRLFGENGAYTVIVLFDGQIVETRTVK